MASLSVLLSIAAYFTAWAGLFFFLCPIAAVLGYFSDRKFTLSHPTATTPERASASVPVLLAVGVLCWGWWLMNTQYHA